MTGAAAFVLASTPPQEIHPLATIDAALNALATALLIAGWALIKRGRERAHMWTMLAAFGVSTLFLACYLTYHFGVGSQRTFQGEGAIRGAYFALLISHIVLAALVPPLAGATIYLGLRDRRRQHRRLARWTLPIWLYVSITGVVIYGMLYLWD